MSNLSVFQDVGSQVLAMIEARPNLGASTKAKYKRAVLNYLETKASLTDVDALVAYAAKAPKSTRAFLKAALRIWGEGIELRAKAGATPENVHAVQAIVFRVQAINEAIKVEESKGKEVHAWLTQAQVKQMIDACSLTTLQGKQKRVILGLLVGAGLRRDELVNLTFDDIALIPSKGKFRTILNVEGKGKKKRAVPISDKLAAILDEWKVIVGDGKIARSVSRGGVIGDSISAVAVLNIVVSVGAKIGEHKLRPHDLRRTYAQLGYNAGVPVTQISRLLGHSSIATTQRYLNLELNLESTVSDFIPL